MDCSSHLNVLQDGGLMQWEGNRNEIEENSSNYWSKMLQLLWDCDWCRKRAESLHSGHVSVILCSKGLYDTTFWWKLLDTGQNLSQCSEKLIKGQQQCRKKKKKMEGRQLNARKFRRWRWWVKIDGKKKKKWEQDEKAGREEMVWQQNPVESKRRNRKCEMDREGWLCVILRTPFIYTWNKRPCWPVSAWAGGG